MCLYKINHTGNIITFQFCTFLYFILFLGYHLIQSYTPPELPQQATKTALILANHNNAIWVDSVSLFQLSLALYFLVRSGINIFLNLGGCACIYDISIIKHPSITSKFLYITAPYTTAALWSYSTWVGSICLVFYPEDVRTKFPYSYGVMFMNISGFL